MKAARVGEHRSPPLHELVQAAQVAHEFIAGAQIKMIGVAQHERSVDVLEMFRRESLDRRLRANRRKDRREEVAVRSGEYPRAGAVVFGGDLEVKHE